MRVPKFLQGKGMKGIERYILNYYPGRYCKYLKGCTFDSIFPSNDAKLSNHCAKGLRKKCLEKSILDLWTKKNENWFGRVTKEDVLGKVNGDKAERLTRRKMLSGSLVL